MMNSMILDVVKLYEAGVKNLQIVTSNPEQIELMYDPEGLPDFYTVMFKEPNSGLPGIDE